jgi:uncharacterized protein YbcI
LGRGGSSITGRGLVENIFVVTFENEVTNSLETIVDTDIEIVERSLENIT